MTKQFETDNWPFIPAKWRTPIVGRRDVRLIVLHAMESPEKLNTARNVGLFFKRGESRASAHVGVDANEIIQYVKDNDVAWCAPGVNNDGIHIEQAGYSKQSGAEWLDPYGVLMLDRVANVIAQYSKKFDLPIVHITNDQLRARQKGIIGHYQATAVYPRNSGHTDPGKGYPWDFVLERAVKHRAALDEKEKANENKT